MCVYISIKYHTTYLPNKESGKTSLQSANFHYFIFTLYYILYLVRKRYRYWQYRAFLFHRLKMWRKQFNGFVGFGTRLHWIAFQTRYVRFAAERQIQTQLAHEHLLPSENLINGTFQGWPQVHVPPCRDLIRVGLTVRINRVSNILERDGFISRPDIHVPDISLLSPTKIVELISTMSTSSIRYEYVTNVTYFYISSFSKTFPPISSVSFIESGRDIRFGGNSASEFAYLLPLGSTLRRMVKGQ